MEPLAFFDNSTIPPPFPQYNVGWSAQSVLLEAILHVWGEGEGQVWEKEPLSSSNKGRWWKHSKLSRCTTYFWPGLHLLHMRLLFKLSSDSLVCDGAQLSICLPDSQFLPRKPSGHTLLTTVSSVTRSTEAGDPVSRRTRAPVEAQTDGAGYKEMETNCQTRTNVYLTQEASENGKCNANRSRAKIPGASALLPRKASTNSINTTRNPTFHKHLICTIQPEESTSEVTRRHWDTFRNSSPID